MASWGRVSALWCSVFYWEFEPYAGRLCCCSSPTGVDTGYWRVWSQCFLNSGNLYNRRACTERLAVECDLLMCTRRLCIPRLCCQPFYASPKAFFFKTFTGGVLGLCYWKWWCSPLPRIPAQLPPPQEVPLPLHSLSHS